eukprot:ANDGO_03685.mRNA.1 Protein SGT1 homolog A
MSSGDSRAVFADANAKFVDEDFSGALSQYNCAISLDSKQPEFYVKRAACKLKLSDASGALEDANAALKLDSSNAGAFLRKGIALFALERLFESRSAFENCLQKDASNAQASSWIAKCNTEIQNRGLTAPSSAPVVVSDEKPKPPRWEWFQSMDSVTIDVFLKGITKDQVRVDATPSSVDITIQLSASSEFTISKDLFAEIDPSNIRVKVMGVKVEITLPKKVQDDWDGLEATSELANVKKPSEVVPAAPAASSSSTAEPTTGARPAYPTSSKKKVDWDSVEKEVENESKDEKLEGDAALMKLFRDIYSKGDPETKKAMMKSYQESGGTVLSTNWKDVGSRQVVPEPPKGMQPHKWNE